MGKVSFFLKLPKILAESIDVANKLKNTSGPDKKKIVISSIQDSDLLTEFGINASVLNQKEVKELIDEYIELQVQLNKLKDRIIAIGAEIKTPTK